MPKNSKLPKFDLMPKILNNKQDIIYFQINDFILLKSTLIVFSMYFPNILNLSLKKFIIF